MSARITVDLAGEAGVQQMLGQLMGRELNNRLRRVVRAGAAVFREVLREKARAGDFPASFAKTKTTNHRMPIATSVYPASSLVNIFEGGAGEHVIGGSGQVLFNPDTGFAARGPVLHPGMGARPLVGPSFEEGRHGAGDASERALWEGVR